jgi:hypothetical protein
MRAGGAVTEANGAIVVTAARPPADVWGRHSLSVNLRTGARTGCLLGCRLPVGGSKPKFSL